MKSKKLYTLFLIVFILSSCELFNQEEVVPKKKGVELEAPSGLVATTDEIDQITLKWDYSYSDVKVNIYRSVKKESNFTLLKSIEGGIKEYVDKDLAPNSQFYYYIAFEYKNSEGPLSETVYGISLFKTQELFCTEGYQELTFTWDEREGIDYYKLYRSYENLIADNIKSNSYILKPTNSWEEEYYLVAVAGGEEGIPSAEVSSKLSVLTSPSNFKAIPSPMDIKLIWDPVPGAEYYKIKYDSSSNSGDPFYIVEDLVDTTYTHTTPDYKWSNYYELFAYRKDGTISNSYSRVRAETTKLDSVTSIKGEMVDDNTFRLTWINAAGITHYKIYRSPNWWSFDYKSEKVGEITSGAAFSIDVSTLRSDEYGYWVVSVLGDAKIGVSEVFRHVFIPTPVITGISIDIYNICPKLTLDNSRFLGGDSINLYRSKSEQGEFIKVQSNLSTSHPLYDNSLLEVGKFYYKVATVNSDRIEGPLSKSVEITFNAPTRISCGRDGFSKNAIIQWYNNKFANTFEVWRSSSENGLYSRIALNISGSKYIDQNLNPGEYFYKVRGITESGVELEFSSVGSVKMN